jgi:PAS domain S-box-containing protein
LNREARSQVHQALLSRRQAIADDWYKAIARASFASLSTAEVRQSLVQLTEQAIALLFTQPFEPSRAEAIGASLASFHYLQPAVLGRTQEILAQQLVEGLPADQAAALQPRLAELLGGVAAGFFQQARETILTEQEQIRTALITELRQAQEALWKAYEEVEQQVQERTAELQATNESLQREIMERKRAEEALQESEERFRGIFENATIGLYRTTPDGRILVANPALVRMLGHSSFEELAQRNLEEEGYEPEYPRSAFKQRIESEGQVIGLESAWVRHDGSTLFVREGARVIRDQAGNTLYYEGTVEDITERRQAEEALQKAHDELEMQVQQRTAELARANEALRAEIAERKRVEEELRDREATMRALLNAPTDVAVLLDASGTILALNGATAQGFGKSEDELVGSCVYDLFPPAVANFRKAQVDKVFQFSTPVRFEDEREGRAFDNSFYPVFDAQGNVVRIAIYSRDITPRKQAEEEIRNYQERLRSLASQLSLAEERERRRIATVLHDRIVQTLALAKINLGLLQRPVSYTDLAEPLNEIQRLIEQAIQDTRSLTFEISSPILYQFGLEAAVEWLTEQIRDRRGIPCEFRDDGRPKPLDEDVKVLLYQAVRELLINVVKHAQAHSAKVSIRREGNDMQITVEDDGVGFDTSDISSLWSRSEGFGLFSIRTRLDHLGGQLDIQAKPGHGTRVNLVVPLK